LLRQGIVFTEAQKDAYTQILETNGEIAAQDYLLGELGTTFEGAAEAASNPFLRLQAILEDFQETLGSAFLPAIEKAIPVIQAAVDSFVASPEFATFIDDAAESFAGLLEFLPDALEIMTKLGQDALPVLNELIPAFTGLLKLSTEGMESFGNETGSAFQNLENLAFAIKLVVDFGNGLNEWLNNTAKELGDFGGIFKAVFKSIYESVFFVETTLRRVFDLFRLMTGASAKDFGFTEGSLPIRPSRFDRVPMAEGGIVTRATNALIGEAGPEAIIPLDRLGKMGGGSTYNITVSAMNADARVGELIVSAIKKYERTSGSVFVSA
jgi:hypothetical protein